MVNSPSVNGDGDHHHHHASAHCDGHHHGEAEALITTAHQVNQQQQASLNPTSNSNATTPTMTPLQLLQSFLKAQSTRTSISNELIIAFSEVNITDLALNKVIEISSAGLLEVKSECQAVINLLSRRVDEATSSSNTTSVVNNDVEEVRKMMMECKAIERLEKDRIGEELKRLQLLRIGKLNDLAEEEMKDSGVEQDSEAACIVEQRQKAESIKSALGISQGKVQSLVEEINERLQEIREYVADASMDE